MRRNIHFRTRLFFIMSGLLLGLLSSCSTYRQYQYITEEYEIPSTLLKADYNLTWQAVIQIMKKYDLAFQSQEAGVVKTRWIDNTAEMNFVDSFSASDSVKAAKFKIILNVVKGFRGTKEVTKVTVFKRQLVEQDFLQGWKEVPTDGILEQTVLYRISRTIKLEEALRKLEETKSKEEPKEF